MTDLEQAVAALVAKQKPYTRLWNYYDGEQPLVYTARRLADLFKHLDAYFAENWCGVVVDAVNERLRLTGYQTGDSQAQGLLDQAWTEGDLALEASDIHEAALVCGESYAIVWPDDEGTPQVYYNDPRLCHVVYDAERRKLARMAAKWWVDEDGYRRVTLYYPDRLEYYRSNKRLDDLDPAAGWRDLSSVADPAVNPYGIVPVFHFRPERRRVKSDLADALPVQDAINKLLADMMVAAEFGAFPQRYVISNADTSSLKNAPNEIWELPAGDGAGQPTQAGQFAAVDLGNYISAIDRAVRAMGAITRTPRHYFFNQGGDPSGEALVAMESPLNKKAQDRIDAFTSTHRRLASFLLTLMGRPTPPHQIQPVFGRPETVQPLTQSIIRQNGINAGLPLRTQLRREGWTEPEIERMEDDRQAEESVRQTLLAGALLDAQRRFDQGGAA